MMIWLDFFLQAFVYALAWCLAVIVSMSLVGAGVWMMVTRAMGPGQ